jgi:hypothetical protein
VLAERESRELLAAAARLDVGCGGRFAAGPAGIQVWDGPFNGPSGTHGTARHLGSVDWSYDTPAKHYVTIYRVMVTQAGVEVGETTLSMLSAVLGLGGLPVDGARITLPAPPARDPFRRTPVSAPQAQATRCPRRGRNRASDARSSPFGDVPAR